MDEVVRRIAEARLEESRSGRGKTISLEKVIARHEASHELADAGGTEPDFEDISRTRADEGGE
jgi:hypothetical protein